MLSHHDRKRAADSANRDNRASSAAAIGQGPEITASMLGNQAVAALARQVGTRAAAGVIQGADRRLLRNKPTTPEPPRNQRRLLTNARPEQLFMLYARRQDQESLNGGVFDKTWIHGEGEGFVRWRIRQELDQLANRGDSTQLAALARFLETNRGKFFPAQGSWLREAVEHRRRQANGGPQPRGAEPRAQDNGAPEPAEGERTQDGTAQRPEVPAAEEARPADEGAHYPLTVRGRTLDFYVYADPRGAEARSKIDALATYFERLPESHLAVIWPFFVMRVKPDTREGGGTWRNSDARVFLRREERTGVPPAAVQQHVIDRGVGMIGCSQGRWQRPLSSFRFTVFHEVSHNVDNVLRLTPPGATEADFLGIDTSKCGLPACSSGVSSRPTRATSSIRTA